MEYVLLVIAGACVIALIYINGKSKALEKEAVAASDTSGTNSETGASTDKKQGPDKSFGPPQYTIYEFSPKAGKRLCPFCDGENGADARKCSICGKNISSGKG